MKTSDDRATVLHFLLGYPEPTGDEEFTLSWVIGTLAGAWRFLLAAGLLGLFIAAAASVVRHPVYTASIYVVPVDEEPSLNNLGLRSLLGSTQEKTSPFLEYRFALTSTAVASELMHDSYITHYVFAPEWDAKTQHWRPASGLLSALVRGMKSAFGYPEWEMPDAVRLAEYLNRHIVVGNDIQTNVQQISVSDHDRAFTLYLLKAVHTNAVKYLQNKMLAITVQKISYLESKLPTVSAVDYRQALVALLAEQQKILLTQREGMPYAAQILDGPAAPVTPTSISPIIVLFLGWFIGLTAAVPIILLFARRSF